MEVATPPPTLIGVVDVGVGERREERAAGRDDERDERDDDRVEVSCLTSVPSLRPRSPGGWAC